MPGSTHSLGEESEANYLTLGDGHGHVRFSLTMTTPEDGELAVEEVSGTPTVTSVPESTTPATLVNRKKSTLSSEPSARRPRTGTRLASVGQHQGSGRSGLGFMGILRSASTLLVPERQVGKDPSTGQSLMAVVRASYLNILLIFIPVSWALQFTLPEAQTNRDTLIFVFSFLAIIPLTQLHDFATDTLSLRVGPTLASLIGVTLGNTVVLIVAIIALVKCEIRIVQSSLIGSVLSNLLLFLGMCFFAGGLRFSEQGFGTSATQLNSSLLAISVIAVLLPVAFHFVARANGNTSAESHEILAVSRASAIILLIIYVGYLLFQLWSHAQFFQDDSPDVAPSTEFEYSKKRKAKKAAKRASKQQLELVADFPVTATRTSRANTFSWTEEVMPTVHEKDVEGGSIESQCESPQMNKLVTMCLLVVSTMLVGVTVEWLVGSINGLTASGTIGKEFVGFVLLPIVGGAAEHVSAVALSVKDKLNLSLGAAVGSSLQIALFVIPFIVTLGWILDKPMTLLFDPYESIVMFFSVLVVNYVVQDGKSHWMGGFLLMMLYLILAITIWFYPGTDSTLFQCS